MDFESFESFIERIKTDELHHSSSISKKKGEKTFCNQELIRDTENLSKQVKEDDLMQKIDASLDERNKVDFLRYTSELNALKEKDIVLH